MNDPGDPAQDGDHDPLDDTQFDSWEAFDRWLKSGGAEQMDRRRAEKRAMERQRIRAGEVPLETLAARLLRRAARLYKFAKMDAPYVIKDSAASLAEKAAEDCTLHRTSHSPDYTPSHD